MSVGTSQSDFPPILLKSTSEEFFYTQKVWFHKVRRPLKAQCLGHRLSAQWSGHGLGCLCANAKFCVQVQALIQISPSNYCTLGREQWWVPICEKSEVQASSMWYGFALASADIWGMNLQEDIATPPENETHKRVTTFFCQLLILCRKHESKSSENGWGIR